MSITRDYTNDLNNVTITTPLPLLAPNLGKVSRRDTTIHYYVSAPTYGTIDNTYNILNPGNFQIDVTLSPTYTTRINTLDFSYNYDTSTQDLSLIDYFPPSDVVPVTVQVPQTQYR